MQPQVSTNMISNTAKQLLCIFYHARVSNAFASSDCSPRRGRSSFVTQHDYVGLVFPVLRAGRNCIFTNKEIGKGKGWRKLARGLGRRGDRCAAPKRITKLARDDATCCLLAGTVRTPFSRDRENRSHPITPIAHYCQRLFPTTRLHPTRSMPDCGHA